jgi:hypothetical protein
MMNNKDGAIICLAISTIKPKANLAMNSACLRFHHCTLTGYKDTSISSCDFNLPLKGASFMKPGFGVLLLPIVLTAYGFVGQHPQPPSTQDKERALSLKPSQPTERRVALVMGNSNYKDTPLLNPVNDARDMAQLLGKLGFEVLHGENLSLNEMKRLIRAFGDKIANGGVGLFYYAGHGAQIKGTNYLIPVDAQIRKEEEVEYESLDVGFALAQMESARNRLNIVILDACRNNPFARSFRSAKSGLASIDAPSGTLIAYATAPGSVASDGDGRNGLYTMELLTAIRNPGAKLEDVFKRVRIAVQARTAGQQVPWESSSLTGDFYFTEKGNTKEDVAPSLINLKALKELDRTDSRLTATAILQAYKTRDLLALSELSTRGNRAILSEVIKEGEQHPRYNSIFSGWRWQSIQAWQGQVGESRYRQLSETENRYLKARVKFAENGRDSFVVVTLILEDGKWCFEDINNADRQGFEADSKVKQM